MLFALLALHRTEEFGVVFESFEFFYNKLGGT
jgi:hypothetical protein